MSIFFQKMDVRHGEYVPKNGPVLFVANHPNSIMDALVMGLVTKRKVNYIGHAGLFSNKLKSWFLRSCGVIPVYRQEDALDKMTQNVSMFEACYQALENGETIGIFPEGTSDMQRKIKKVKTGAARIALETERRNDYTLGMQVIPIGLYFFSRSRFRSRVLLNVGAPINLEKFFELNKKDNYEAVHQLTTEIQTRLEQLTVNIQHEDLDQFVRDIEVLYRDELKQEMPGEKNASEASFTEFFLTQKIADCVEYYYKNEPIKVRELQEKINLYKRKLKRLRLKDEMLKEKVTFGDLFKGRVKEAGRSFIGLPFAIFGIINNFMPYLITESIAKKFIDDRTKILSALLISGGIAFLFFYTIQVTIVWYLSGEIWSTLYFITLPVTGLFALAYLRQIREEQERLSLSFFLFTNRQLFSKMRRERRNLISEMDKIKEEYLSLIRPKSEATVSRV